MTRINGAHRGLNAFLDQIVNTRSDAAASASGAAASGNSSAFDSQLARFSPDANAGSSPEDTNPSAQNATGETATNQKNPGNAVSALFAALTNGGDSAEATNSPQLSSLQSISAQTQVQTTATSAAFPQSDPTDTASALFAALSGSDGSAADTSNLNAASQQDAAKLSTLLSLANTGASGNQAQAAQARAATDATQDDGFLPLPRLTTVQKLTGTGTSASSSTASASSSKRISSLPISTKHADQTAAPSSDLAASAQMTVAMVANALTPQNTPAPVTVRKDAVTSAPPSTGTMTQTKGLKGLSLDDAQSSSDSVQPVTQDVASNPFADFSAPDDSDSHSIKMTVSSIHAETHFAPVQQLSPTQQIFDFVALTGDVSSLPDAGTADAASAVAASSGTATAGAASSVTASLSASPVKTLTLALEPDALGTVTIKMRLVNAGLEVQVEAEKSDTTSLIEKDKDDLSSKLQTLGYSVDSLVVRTVATQSAHQDPSNDQSAAGQGQQQNANDASASGSSQNGGRNSNDQSPAQNRGQGSGGFNQDPIPDLSSNRTLGDGVYL